MRHWRLQQLLELGFDPETAERFARSSEVDLAFARRLILKGCTIEKATKILEPS